MFLPFPGLSTIIHLIIVFVRKITGGQIIAVEKGSTKIQSMALITATSLIVFICASFIVLTGVKSKLTNLDLIEGIIHNVGNLHIERYVSTEEINKFTDYYTDKISLRPKASYAFYDYTLYNYSLIEKEDKELQ